MLWGHKYRLKKGKMPIHSEGFRKVWQPKGWIGLRGCALHWKALFKALEIWQISDAPLPLPSFKQ
jgi:hypothetical protein